MLAAEPRAVVRVVRAAAVAPLEERARRRTGRRAHPAQVDALRAERLAHELTEAVVADARDPRDVDAEPRERDREVRLRAGDPQRQRPAELERPVLDGIEEHHGLPDREDA